MLAAFSPTGIPRFCWARGDDCAVSQADEPYFAVSSVFLFLEDNSFQAAIIFCSGRDWLPKGAGVQIRRHCRAAARRLLPFSLNWFLPPGWTMDFSGQIFCGACGRTWLRKTVSTCLRAIFPPAPSLCACISLFMGTCLRKAAFLVAGGLYAGDQAILVVGWPGPGAGLAWKSWKSAAATPLRTGPMPARPLAVPCPGLGALCGRGLRAQCRLPA